MFTLVICLVVVALSGAAVLHITLVDQTQRATRRPRRPRGPGPAAVPVPVPADADLAAGAPPIVPEDGQEDRLKGEHGQGQARVEAKFELAPAANQELRRHARPAPSGGHAGSAVLADVHRARSAGLLVLLLAVLGAVLALLVAVAAVAAVVALRAALVA